METVAERTENEDVSMVNENAMSMCTTHPEWDGMSTNLSHASHLPAQLALLSSECSGGWGASSCPRDRTDKK